VRKRQPPATILATVASQPLLRMGSKLLKELEARVGIEPTHKGFADLSLTTWVPRLGRAASFSALSLQTTLANPAGAGGRNGAGDEI